MRPPFSGAARGRSIHRSGLSHRDRSAGLPGIAGAPRSNGCSWAYRAVLQPVVNIESDDLLGSYQATQHLLKSGHKRIAFFSGPPATPWTHERFAGYRRALREAGLDVDEKLVFQAGRSIDDGAKAALQMIN